MSAQARCPRPLAAPERDHVRQVPGSDVGPTETDRTRVEVRGAHRDPDMLVPSTSFSSRFPSNRETEPPRNRPDTVILGMTMHSSLYLETRRVS